MSEKWYAQATFTLALWDDIDARVAAMHGLAPKNVRMVTVLDWQILRRDWVNETVDIWVMGIGEVTPTVREG